MNLFTSEETRAAVLAWDRAGRKQVSVTNQAVVNLARMYPRHSADSWSLKIWNIQRAATDPGYQTTALVHEVLAAYLAGES